MQKRIKKYTNHIILSVLMFISFILNTNASTATVGFSGANTTALNENLTVRLFISNISGTNGGIVSLGGNLSFDAEHLEYVSGTGITSPYTFQINTLANYKIAGLDTTLNNGITGTSATNVFTFVFKPLKMGNTTISFINGKLTDTTGEVTGTYQSKVIEVEEAKNSTNTLSNLSISGYTISPEFNSNTLNYSLTVSNSVESINVVATPSTSLSTISGTGTKSLSEGLNVIKIIVTAENKATKTYTINVTRGASNKVSKETKSSDNSIKSLNIANGELSPEFNSSRYKYTLLIPNEVTSLDISYELSNNKATAKIIGNSNFKINQKNIVKIEVTAEDGSKKEYEISVTRSLEESNNKLETLLVNKGVLSPKFDSQIYDYKIEVENEVTSLIVTADAKNKKAKVEIIGNEDLQVGNNTVLVRVTDENNFVQYYKISVNRKSNRSIMLFGLSEEETKIVIILGINLLLAIIIIILLLKSKKNTPAPVIEIKPEFNFNSKNDPTPQIENKSEEKKYIEASYQEKEEIYDPYDDVVTKDEVINAIEEKDIDTLKILYEQEMLNRKKAKIKEKKELNKRQIRSVDAISFERSRLNRNTDNKMRRKDDDFDL